VNDLTISAPDAICRLPATHSLAPAMRRPHEIVVRPVRTRAERRRFLSLPAELNRGDPLWVPALRHEEAALVGFRRHPFHAKNTVQPLLAWRDGEVVGRIAAIHNRRHNEYQQDRLGFFGFFECQDDPHVAAALLAAAGQWLAARGLEGMRGPFNPSINYSAGLLVEGFEHPPSFLMPYNPPYYGALLERCGCEKSQDLYAYRGRIEQLPQARQRMGALADQIAERFEVRVRPLNRRRMREDLATFLTVVNQSLIGHWSCVPFAHEEVLHAARNLSWLLLPEMVIGAEIDGRLVGVALAIPDYSERLRRIGGRLFPCGFLRLLWNKRGIRRYRVIAANVLPEYHLMGIGLVLMVHGLRRGRASLQAGADEVEFSWVAESNDASRGALEKGGAVRTKTYRVYERSTAI
jgi:hypothetical protein